MRNFISLFQFFNCIYLRYCLVTIVVCIQHGWFFLLQADVDYILIYVPNESVIEKLIIVFIIEFNLIVYNSISTRLYLIKINTYICLIHLL